MRCSPGGGVISLSGLKQNHGAAELRLIVSRSRGKPVQGWHSVKSCLSNQSLWPGLAQRVGPGFSPATEPSRPPSHPASGQRKVDGKEE